MTKRDEKTSANIARIAGRILSAAHRVRIAAWTMDGRLFLIPWSDIRALAASALTQTEDKKPKPFTSRAEVRKAVKSLKKKRKAKRK